MNPTSRLRAVVAASLVCAASATLAVPSYHLVDLGANTVANAINNHGVVAGAQGRFAAIYRDGAWHRKPAGWQASAIDDDLDLGGVGPGASGLVYRPAGGAAISLPVPIQSDTGFYLGGIAPGKAVFHGFGVAENDYRCILWTQEAGAVDISGSTRSCSAHGVNVAGQVAGTGIAEGSEDVTAFLWQDGVFTNLGALGGRESEAVAINARGHVAMTAYTAANGGDSVSHLALYNGRKVVNLGSLSTHGAVAYGMNDRDEVIGLSWDKKYGRHAVLSSGGVLTKLDEVVDNLPADWDLGTPSGIDNAGVIVGTAYVGELMEMHGYMLVPNPQ